MFASITNRVATGVAATVLVSAPVLAQGNYVIGSSAGLTGYAATLDRAWVDGVTVAIRRLNDERGVLGKKITLVVEDNRSEPQEAVSAYRKMLSSDGAQAFVSGCLSAGNFAAAPVIIRQKIPMVEIAKVLGKDMFFVVGQTQVFASISESDPVKKAIADFVAPWRELYGDRDPFWAGRGYDAMMILATAVRKANSLDGEKVRDGLNTITVYQGTSGLYNFSKDHNGVTQNPYDLAQIIDGKVVIVR